MELSANDATFAIGGTESAALYDRLAADIGGGKIRPSRGERVAARVADGARRRETVENLPGCCASPVVVGRLSLGGYRR